MKQAINAINTINERITTYGVDYLTDAEAMSTITGISLKLLKDIITAYGYHGLIRHVDVFELTSDQRIKLELVYNICQRIGKAVYHENIAVKKAEDIAQLFVSELQFEPVEIVAIALLDARNQLIKMEKIFIGTVSSAVVYQRDVVRRAILYNASSVIIGHNHPSGVPQPSNNDIAMTIALEKALSLMNVILLDHILVGNNQYISFRDKGIY